MSNFKLLSFKEILILVLIITPVAAIALTAFGPRTGNLLTYSVVIVLVVVALVLKNTSLKTKLFNKPKSKPLPE